MKRFKVVVLSLVLALVGLASTPRHAAADDCCDSALQDAENACAQLGTSLRYFYCVPGYEGSLCGWSYDCYPPPQ